MKAEVVPLSEGLIPACRAFNARLRRYGSVPFFLPEEAPNLTCNTPTVSWNHFVAVDQEGEVRGGVLLMEQSGWLCGRQVQLVNVQSPISEGVFDRKFAGVSLQMLKFILGRSPYAYSVGMGSDQNPFARLLNGAGWRVDHVPFFFSVIRANRFLREIRLLRRGPRKLVAHIAATTGIGAALAGLWRLAHRAHVAVDYSLETTSFLPEEIDKVWDRCRPNLSLCSTRNAESVGGLYPASQNRLRKFILCHRGEVVGWSVALVKAMDNNSYFGSLTVGTILDGLSNPQHLSALANLSKGALADFGADVVITNQMHINWQKALLRLGFIPGPSNFLLALSKPIVATLQTSAGGNNSHVHVNRGDGDGRLNL